MLENDKICFLGLPRCGSQYIMELIQVNGGYKNLLEPFTYDHSMSIDVVDGKIQCIFKEPFRNYEKQMSYVFEKLDSDYEDKRIIIKFFPADDVYLKTFNMKILDCLKMRGFKIIIIERGDFEKHLISWLVARHTGVWHNHKLGDINNFTLGNIHPDATLFVNKWLYFKEFLRSMDSGENLPKIRYENAVDDIKNIFGFENIKKARLIKILPENPYEKISNTDEVRSEIEQYIKLIKNENYTNK